MHSRWIRRNGAQGDVAESTERVTASRVASPDLFAKALEYTRPQEVRAMGLYPYFYPVESSDGTEVVMEGRRRIITYNAAGNEAMIRVNEALGFRQTAWGGEYVKDL